MKTVLILVALAFGSVAGCTTYHTGPPKQTASVAITSFLQTGITQRDEIAREWGQPSRRLQSDRIWFYRLEGTGDHRRFSDETGPWQRARESIVLVFNSQGLLERSSVVKIR